MSNKRLKMGAVQSEPRVVLEHRMIENPLMTDGLVDAGLEAGQAQPRWSPAIVNRVTVVGGLAHMKGLSDAQLAAAGRYRTLTERATIGGSMATDYSAVKVDVSGSGRDVVLDGADARRELTIARRRLGPFQASLLDKVVCDEKSVREVAQASGAEGGNGRLRTSKRVRSALDDLVDIFALGRRRVRGEGETASDWAGSEDGATDPKAH